MTDKIRILPGKPHPMGVRLEDGEIHFALPFKKSNCGIVLYDDVKKKKHVLSFSDVTRVGNVYCGRICGLDKSSYSYELYEEDTFFTDPYAKQIIGNEKFSNKEKKIRAGVAQADYDWEKDSQLCIPYNKSLIYMLHTRGFTKHTSSGVQNKGTVEGIVEKIPYLKELGITAVELMPSYEFMEWEKTSIDENIPLAYQEKEKPINYWGYKKAFYFAPKSSYCAGKNPVKAFKEFVHAMHKENMEVIMQFFFPNDVKHSYIISVLEYWVEEYHIDGVHLLGEQIPVTMLATNPILANTKLLYYDFPINEIYRGNDKAQYMNLGVCNDTFMYDVRKLLKSDERMLQPVLNHMKYIPAKTGNVHYITQANGFTLSDLVSYDRKHNEDNGENNRDGNPYNASWNCGVEGKTRKKSILALRLKQMKNAIAFNLLSQGTPMLLAGDEFGNSQNGNNNAYCHDNSLTWLNWNDLGKNRELFDYVKAMIAFRQKHPVFTAESEFKMTDYLSCGYPDLSYHSEEAWKLSCDDLTRHFAMMYCGEYANDCDVYLAINMHWVPHSFALPKLEGEKNWYVVMDTSMPVATQEKLLSKSEKEISVSERSIKIVLGKK